ncbi:acyl-CoA thioesterase [Grimontia marina]|uniref:1,4-dihydroxy-2-naphthoyl-CoA hydrolase n=1 Tax=Grimontia marina TaxID=646534 RepID=A0A128EZM6_9GAMM|nr:thioesterase family protein [Grimontia marina]CZF80022.1 1,4-dihydroxy-2-naphthoyl-CoA hydrolase [Grimontia marina]
MAFIIKQKVLFKHCDPAGIVFYPRYFEMINDVVEMFFSDVLQRPFEELLKNGGLPTAEISTRFHSPSRHGDCLQILLEPRHLGHSSMGVVVIAMCNSEERFTSSLTLVNVDSGGKSCKWDDAIREKITSMLSPGMEKMQ